MSLSLPSMQSVNASTTSSSALSSTSSHNLSTDSCDSNEHRSKNRHKLKYCSFCLKYDWNLKSFDKRINGRQIQQHFGVQVCCDFDFGSNCVFCFFLELNCKHKKKKI